MQLNIKKLNECFEKSKYSKREVAKRCGFTRPTLDGLLQGSDVKVSTLVAWATFFNKPISYFFDEDIEVQIRQAGRDYVEEGKIEHHGTENNTSESSSTSKLEKENAELKDQLIKAQATIIDLLNKQH